MREDEHWLERGSIDGRVAFGIAAFVVGVGLIVLLERVGAPDRIVRALGPLAIVVGLASIGLLLRTMRISGFYAGARAAPAPYVGFALAALATGLFLPFLPPASNDPALGELATGFAAGGVIAFFVTGPLLRKSGAFSITDLLSTRFPQAAFRLGLVGVTAVVSFFVAAAAYEVAVRGVQTGLGLDRAGATLLAGAAIVLIAIPGGLSGVVWSAMAAGAVLLAGWASPLVIAATRGRAVPLPVFGSPATWTGATARLADWSRHVDLRQPSGPLLAVGLAIGLGALAPLIVPIAATRDRKSAHRAGRLAALWLIVFGCLAAVTLATGALALQSALVGRRPGDLPGYAYDASARGLLLICGRAAPTPIAAASNCGVRGAQPLRSEDIAARGAFLATGLPEVADLGQSWRGLTAAAVIAVALALAASAFQALATAIGNDAFYRVRGPDSLTSTRLAITRGALAASVVTIGLALVGHSVDSREMIGLAISFSAAALAPLLALAFWPRASSADATFALLCGLGAAETAILFQGSTPSLPTLTASAAVAFVAASLAGVISSLLRPADPLRGGAIFIDRILHGENDAVSPDKGA